MIFCDLHLVLRVGLCYLSLKLSANFESVVLSEL